MPTNTSFLSLTLPELNEFVSSWHTPLNQNFEAIDDYLSSLSTELVGATGTSSITALKGTMASLLARLAVSIEDDGTIDLSGADDLVALATSKTDGVFADASARFEQADLETFGARPGFQEGRFETSGAVLPVTSQSYPRSTMDVGMAWRTRDYATSFMGSPAQPWAPGLASGNPSLLNAPGGVGIIQLQGETQAAVFNIDGYLFRIRENITIDVGAISGVSDEDYVWLYVERVEAGYIGGLFQYNTGAKDLRVLQSGAAGSTSGSTFTQADAGVKFETPDLGKVYPGDLLNITSGTAAGTYLVDTVDSDTQLTIKGTFPTDVGGLAWNVRDEMQPNIGGVVTDSDPTTEPAAVTGRVYIGRCKYDDTVIPQNIVTFAPGGVYDSGWEATDGATLASGGYLPTDDHNLGVVPTHVEVWMRESSGTTIYKPLILRKVATSNDGSDVNTYDSLLFPSVTVEATATTLKVLGRSAITAQAAGAPPDVIPSGVAAAMFTKDLSGSPADVTSGEIRVIARR